jgi:RNA polymerase sigma-70 factor (ECF subfamily)
MNTAADARRLYQQHFRLVYRTALLRGIPVQDAEDVTQQVFAKALSSYNGARPFSPYVLQITRNEVCDFHKYRGEEPSLLPLQVRDERLTAEEWLRLKQQWRLLADLLDRLESNRRIVFELAEIEQFSQAEIAELLGIPVTTVESRLRDARAEVDEAIERLRKRDSLPAVMLTIQALKDIEIPSGAQARGWRPVWRSILRRRAWRAAQVCAVAVLPGLLPLPSIPVDPSIQASSSDPPAMGLAIPSDTPAQQVPRNAATPESPSDTLSSTTPPGASRASPPAAEGPRRDPAPTRDKRERDDPAQSELILMLGARHALRAGNIKLTLQELERHTRLYPHGSFAQLRDAMLDRIRQRTRVK